MATKVLAPSLGEGVDELVVVKWLKKEGELVKEFESLLEVETDKVITEIPSPATGILLKLLVPESEPVKVGMTVAWIGEQGEKIQEDTPPKNIGKYKYAELRPAGLIHENHALEKGIVNRQGFISPIVARIAGEKNIDLSKIKGTGLGGRITKKDVLDHLESHEKSLSEIEKPGDRLIPHSVIRKTIAERMILSKQTSPHVMTVMEADISKVVQHRNQYKDLYARDGINLTFTAYFIAATVAGLKAFPKVNSSWTDEGIMIHSTYNIGMATSLGEDGLIVPVVKNADQLSLSGIAKAVNDLAGRARVNKLQPAEVRGGTFTLTNHGVSRSLFAMPIINQPQCGILGTGMIRKRAIVVTDNNGNDAIAIRPMIYISFVFDHRILDGIMADWFLSKVVESLENWQS
jgi:2-oxoisovalerate dehydrogenase E2 component (dihydrolipoyl transacylase)